MNSSSLSKRAFDSVRIVGSGLIGTSIGLGLTAIGVKVTMVDADKTAEKMAQDLMATPATDEAEMVIFATPSSKLSDVLNWEYALNPHSKFIDIGSVKTKPLLEVSKSKLPNKRFLATHPMAGREVGGVESARADLFKSRTWIYIPNDLSGVCADDDVLEATLWMISSLGASALSMSAPDHDQAVALVSHLPQAASSLLAGQLNGAPRGFLDLSGSGLRDTTRIAASPAALWDEILSANSEALLPLLISLQNDLGALITDLQTGKPLHSFIEDGNSGRALIPGKHGGIQREYTQLPVVIEDKPGQLAALFDECAKAMVNVEDLRIEHSPGQFTGLITLALSASDAQILQEHLANLGWKVQSPR
jgi:prephenate dehydrogenase